jgi:hypothetical protein
MERLEPEPETAYSDRINSVAGQLGDLSNKRVGGGRVQMGITTFTHFADAIIPSKSGYDKQKKSGWKDKNDALARIFLEYGWPDFQEAVIIAVIRKHSVDPKDGFIPLAPGSIDIEAGLNIVADLHKEAVISGIPQESLTDTGFATAISQKIGITTEYGNGDSIELVVPFYTRGRWQKVEDTEFGRRTGVIIVTPVLTLYCEGMDINSLQKPPYDLLSVKTIEAIKIARQLCRECNIR